MAQLGVGTMWGAAAPAGGSLPGAAASFSGLRQLSRHFHASPGLWAAEQGGPTINPLQQAPVPAPGGAGAAASSPLGPALTLAGGDVSDTSRAVARGLAISPQKLNDFAKVVRGLSLADAFYQVGARVGGSWGCWGFRIVGALCRPFPPLQGRCRRANQRRGC